MIEFSKYGAYQQIGEEDDNAINMVLVDPKNEDTPEDPKDQDNPPGGNKQHAAEEELYQCFHQDPLDTAKPCSFRSKSDIMIGTYERAVHLRSNMVSRMLKEEEPKDGAE